MSPSTGPFPEPTPEPLRIVVIDDDTEVRHAIAAFLEASGQHVRAARSGEEGLALLDAEPADVVLTDVQMPGLDGFGVLAAVRQRSPETEVLVMTGHGDLERAVRAMREGAFDYFTKPVQMRELEATLQKTSRFHRLRQEHNRFASQARQRADRDRQTSGIDALVGDSPGMRRVKDAIVQVAPTKASVLIRGETGTGKELVARAIHFESERGDGPFVSVNCTAIPETLLESEFFGHEKGAFTGATTEHAGFFEQADGGTLFLDEIGDMHAAAQARLLRALEERRVRRLGSRRDRPVDVRVIAATHRDLQQAIGADRFREDLLYRLNTVTIDVPPLRERVADVTPLARELLRRYAEEMRKPVEGFTDGAEALLQAHAFPGNVRELRNIIERAVIFCTGTHVGATDLGQALSPVVGNPAGAGQEIDLSGDASLDLASLEAAAVTEAMRRADGNQVQAARLLGISRTALRRRLDRHGLAASD